MKLFLIKRTATQIDFISRAETVTDGNEIEDVGDAIFVSRKGQDLFGFSFAEIEEQLKEKDYIEVN